MELIEKLKHRLIGKKIVVYGAADTGTRFMIECERAGMTVDYLVDSSELQWGKKVFDKEVRSPYDLLYEDKDNLRIVVCSLTGKTAIVATLEGMGFDTETHIITDYADFRDGCTHVDMMLGISRGNQNIMQIGEVSGGKAALTILILGGSTSDPTYCGINSWSYYLKKKMREKALNVSILNGAVLTYNSSQELLCLIRDGLHKKPDIVISYTGVNEYNLSAKLADKTKYPLVNKNLYDTMERLSSNYKENHFLPPIYYGEKTVEDFDNFLYNVRSMKALCNEFGAKFFCLFQPILKHQQIEKNTLLERLMEQDGVIELNDNFDKFYGRRCEVKSKYDYIYDFTDIFCNVSDVFVDSSHVNEKGNEIIAEKVLKLLEKELWSSHNECSE